MDKETLLKYEGKLARLFVNSRKSNRLSNAYLLYGPNNAPLKEVAMYLSMSLGCENDLLACKECNSCKRFMEGIRPDFVLIDGQNEMIKKGTIQDLEKKFSMSVYEKGHTLSYVIHRIDNINNEAANAILKFLEEPKVGQIAFLTTTNLEKVLPTIRSRAIAIRVDPIGLDGFYQDLLEKEFVLSSDSKKKDDVIHLSTTQAYLLTKHFSSLAEVEEALRETPLLFDGILAGEAFLNDYAQNLKTASFTLLKETALLKDGKCYNWMYLTILDVFEEVLLNDENVNSPFSDIIHDLQKDREEIQKGLDVLKDFMAHKNLNYNVTLFAGRFLMALNREKR